tara:strand:- start:57 stop:422 length:366 start_codon:yes stop_codon:yes gene_type:complete
MGNVFGCIINTIGYDNTSSLLSLEGWSLISKNNKLIYYNKFNKKEQSEYPVSISDYNDIYDFYNIEMLGPYDTIKYLDNFLKENEKSLTDVEKNKINSYISKIKYENDIDEYNTDLIQLCV